MRTGSGERVAIVAGLRTPFAKQLTAYRNLSALELGKMVVGELLARNDIDPAKVDQVVFGQVLPSIDAPNIAREIVLGTGMDRRTEAFSVSRACATSFQSVVSVTEAICAGVVSVGVAGGADSSSDVPIRVTKRLSSALVALTKARTLKERLEVIAGLRPKDFTPVPPAIKEPSTGLTMGEHAEQMARDHQIPREEQDALAHRSHTRAAAAWAEGKLSAEVLHAYIPGQTDVLSQDNLVRHDSDLASYAKLRPVFDRRYGTITAANSSPLTDGAAAVLLMSESRAKELGLEPLGFVRSYAFAALDPKVDMLMGPAHATPKAMDRAGIKNLSELALIDMHEAFAAQVLCNVRALESQAFARDVLGRDQAAGAVDMDRFNVLGGSIAYGHPFAATGARMITQTLHELRRRGGGLALTTACAAGGIGAAMILEVV